MHALFVTCRARSISYALVTLLRRCAFAAASAMELGALPAYWLGSSLSSEPGGLTGLSVASHAGVLARSKISGSLLHRLSRPWHGLGPGGSHRDQRYGAAPNFLRLRGGRSILLMLSNRRLSILLFRFSLLLLERTSATSSQIVLTNSLKLKQTHVREACVCWSSLNAPRVR